MRMQSDNDFKGTGVSLMSLTALHNWRGYRSDNFPFGSWSVDEDGTLHVVPGAEMVSLISREQYEDFDLQLEWRLPPGGNSGILYLVSEDFEEHWQSGPEMQLLDDDLHPDGRRAETSCGALYDLIAPGRTQRLRIGEFNTARVRILGSSVEHWINGECVLSYELKGKLFLSRLENSKFKGLPEFAQSARGHIVLQHHGTEAWFRKIVIFSIKSDPQPE